MEPRESRGRSMGTQKHARPRARSALPTGIRLWDRYERTTAYIRMCPHQRTQRGMSTAWRDIAVNAGARWPAALTRHQRVYARRGGPRAEHAPIRGDRGPGRHWPATTGRAGAPKGTTGIATGNFGSRPVPGTALWASRCRLRVTNGASGGSPTSNAGVRRSWFGPALLTFVRKNPHNTVNSSESAEHIARERMTVKTTDHTFIVIQAPAASRKYQDGCAQARGRAPFCHGSGTTAAAPGVRS